MANPILIRFYDEECGQFSLPQSKTFDSIEEAEEFCYNQNEDWGGSLAVISITGGTSQRISERYGLSEQLEDLLQQALEDANFIALVGEQEAQRLDEELDVESFKRLIDTNQYPVIN